MPEYKVKQGDCISSIAISFGFSPETLWNHSENADLKRRRRTPNVIYPGDMVFIPEKKLKEEAGETENRYRFRRKGVPVRLRLKLRDAQGPMAREHYVLNVGERLSEGVTDSEGAVQITIPHRAKDGTLRIRNRIYRLKIGHLDPLDTVSGLRGRLANLGYDVGTGGEGMDEKLLQSLHLFQANHDIARSDQADDATQSRLREEHKC